MVHTVSSRLLQVPSLQVQPASRCAEQQLEDAPHSQQPHSTSTVYGSPLTCSHPFAACGGPACVGAHLGTAAVADSVQCSSGSSESSDARASLWQKEAYRCQRPATLFCSRSFHRMRHLPVASDAL